MSPPTSPPGGQGFQELLDRAERLLERIRNKMQELVDTINRILASVPAILIPDFVVEAIQAGICKMDELFAKLMRKMEEFFSSPGWPPALFDAGDRWLTEVGRRSANTEEEINAGHMKVDDYWKGSAAESYKSTLGTQQPAFAAIVTLARKIKDCLHDAAWGIIKFWVAVVVGLVAAAAAIAGAVAALAGVVTAPAAPVAAAGAILGAIVAVGGGAWAAYDQFQGVQQVAGSLQEEAEYNTAFDGDRWPRATAEGEWKAD